jgi:hypothetical protein
MYLLYIEMRKGKKTGVLALLLCLLRWRRGVGWTVGPLKTTAKKEWAKKHCISYIRIYLKNCVRTVTQSI